MLPSQRVSYQWEEFSKRFLPEILQHQEELYSLNFNNMRFDQLFFSHIEQWYIEGIANQDCHSSLLFDLDKDLIGFYLYQKNSTTIYLMQMFVEKKFRNQGYGKLLLNHYEQSGKQKGATSSFLHASSINERAVSFYQKNKYLIMDQEIDEEENPRYLMFKNLLR